MSKVYLVTDGDYSDYRVRGIYSTPELAAAAQRLHNADNDVEEWDLDVIPDHPPGLLPFFVLMDKDGNSEVTPAGAGIDDSGVTWVPGWVGERIPYGISFSIWARDEQHAAKIANEKKAKLVSAGLWGISYDDYWRRTRDNDPTLPRKL